MKIDVGYPQTEQKCLGGILEGFASAVRYVGIFAG